jgi:hypothetical protein
MVVSIRTSTDLQAVFSTECSESKQDGQSCGIKGEITIHQPQMKSETEAYVAIRSRSMA